MQNVAPVYDGRGIVQSIALRYSQALAPCAPLLALFHNLPNAGRNNATRAQVLN